MKYYHLDDLEYFQFLGVYPGAWDGHDTEEKYQRVKKFHRLEEA